jgi:hypothetical protein
MSVEFETLVYTRYLYAVLEVKQSLLLALLEKNLDESLFWAFELYYSGFETSAFEYVMNIYNEFYKKDNPDLEKSIAKAINQDEPLQLGSIITTLCYSKYQMNVFMENYFGLKCKSIEKGEPRKPLFIRMKQQDLIKYETLERDMNELPRFYLKKVCKYAVRKEVTQLFKPEFVSNKKDYEYHWLYYAYNSPIWKDRLSYYNITINHETKDIEFQDDDELDEFYDVWGLEPDEQLLELQEKSIGNGNEKQLSMKDFCEKYGGIVITKSIKIRNSAPDVAALTNSFKLLST